MPSQSYNDFESSESQSYDNYELRFTPYATVSGQLNTLFGNSTQFGQSLGLSMENVSLDDGAIYYYPAKGRFKLFSWKELTGLTPAERIERDMDPLEASDADNVYVESYGGGTQEYELYAARVPEIVDDNGDVLAEADSMKREFSVADVDNDPENFEFGDAEDMNGELVEFGNTITWFGGSEENGPSTTAKTVLEVLSTFGDDAVVDEDDVYNWLPDESADNILRDDLRDRTVEFFSVTRESENGYNYNVPVFIDAATGERITPNNRQASSSGGGSGNENSASADELSDVEASDAADRSYPEPIADFISTGERLNLTEERAESLLDELIADSANEMTAEMVADEGGRDEIIAQVV